MLTAEQKEYIKKLDEKTATVELREEVEGYKFLIIENVFFLNGEQDYLKSH